MEENLSHPLRQALEALKLAYRKHHCGDESIGWEAGYRKAMESAED